MDITVDFFKQILDYVPSCVYFKDTDCKYVYASRYPGDPMDAEKYDVNGLTDFDIIKDKEAAQHAYNLTKQMNDNYGHHIGDEYIRLSTSVLRVSLPEKAIKFRSGGDEFIAIIPNTTKEEGDKLISNMQTMAENITIKGNKISISFGSSCMNSITENFEDALKKADKKMYEQKKEHHKKKK